jgi:ankyrin repeat protein
MSSNKIQTFKFTKGWGRRPVAMPIDGIYPESFGELTDLEFAAAHGRVGIIRILLDTGADVNAKSHWRGFTPLMAAASGGQTETIQFLINSGADLKAKDLLGRTCLFNAVESRDEKTVQILIDSGADVDESDNWGITPLMCAVTIGEVELVKILLSAGADANVTDDNGKTALEHIPFKRLNIPLLGDFCSYQRNKEIFQLLEDANSRKA